MTRRRSWECLPASAEKRQGRPDPGMPNSKLRAVDTSGESFGDLLEDTAAEPRGDAVGLVGCRRYSARGEVGGLWLTQAPVAEANAHRERQIELYWRQLEQLRAAYYCARRYRNRLARWDTTIRVIKGLATLGGTGAWLVWVDLSWFWAAIIAAAQLAEALKSAFPVTKLLHAAAGLTDALETLCIDTEEDWEAVRIGEIGAEAISKRRSRVRRLQAAEIKRRFPDGLEFPADLIRLAAEDAEAYFAITYGNGV